MKVEELIQILQWYDPKANLNYALKDNNKVDISEVEIYPIYDRYGQQEGLAMYFKSKGITSKGKEVWINIG